MVTVPQVLPTGKRRPDLEPRSVDSLLLMLAGSRANTLSGTVQASADLGLPEVPTQPTGGTSTLASLLTGTHTVRIWQDGSDRQRVAVLERLGETDVARNGTTVWTYQSSTDTASIGTLTEFSQSEIAQILLRAVFLPIVTGPDTVVSAGPTDRVAGQDAYTLVIRPKRAGSLVDRIELAVDAEQGTLLRFRVYPSGGANPALQARFTSISYRPPAAKLFDPVLRPVPAVSLPRPGSSRPGPGGGGPGGSSASPVSTIGYGWSAVTKIAGSDLARSAAQTVDTATAPIRGGRVLATPLLSVLITDGGDVYLGTVPLQRLEEVAGL